MRERQTKRHGDRQTDRERAERGRIVICSGISKLRKGDTDQTWV